MCQLVESLKLRVDEGLKFLGFFFGISIELLPMEEIQDLGSFSFKLNFVIFELFKLVTHIMEDRLVFLDNPLTFSGPDLLLKDLAFQTSNSVHLGCKLGVKGLGFLFFSQQALVVLIVCNHSVVGFAKDVFQDLSLDKNILGSFVWFIG